MPFRALAPAHSNLGQIFRHVHPLDLVNLSRTTKSLRAVLLDRSAAWIWKAAIDSFPGMPKPMPGMNEPQYLSLMLDPHCYVGSFQLPMHEMKSDYVCSFAILQTSTSFTGLSVAGVASLVSDRAKSEVLCTSLVLSPY